MNFQRIIWMGLILFGFVSQGYADSQIVEACGSGLILNGNLDGAKKMALVDAKVNALKKAFGAHLTSDRRLVGQGDIWMNISEEVVGSIDTADMMNEFKNGDIYKVCIKAWVRRDTLSQNQIDRLKRDFTIGVCVVDKIELPNGTTERLQPDRTENWLKEALQDQGFRVVDVEYKVAMSGHDNGPAGSFSDRLIQKDTAAIRLATQEALANVLVMGTNTTSPGNPAPKQGKNAFQHIVWSGFYRAEPVLQTLIVDSGELLLTQAPADRFAGYGVSSTSSEDAAKKGSKEAILLSVETLREQLIPYLIQYAGRETHRIEIVIHNLPSDLFNTYRNFIVQLGGWVKNVEEPRYDDTTLTATYPVQYLTMAATPDLLRLQVSAIPDLDMGNLSFTRVEATYKKKN